VIAELTPSRLGFASRHAAVVIRSSTHGGGTVIVIVAGSVIVIEHVNANEPVVVDALGNGNAHVGERRSLVIAELTGLGFGRA
jgi:hypothetical protein